MKTILLLMLSCAFLHGMAQGKISLVDYRYEGYQYSSTCNKSFVNKILLFVKGADTVRVNQKLPYNKKKNEISNEGIYYDCQLDSAKIYTLEFQKIPLKDIPEAFVNYYRINGVFYDEGSPWKFKEKKKNTAFLYLGKYTRYFDINGELLQITGVSPITGCRMDH